MPKSSKRTRQVADMIQRELSLALRQHIQDPRLANISITEVVLSPDMRYAKVYYTLIKDAELESVSAALRNASGHFRHIIAQNSKLRFTPALTFFYDETIAHAERLSQLLKQTPDNSTAEDDEPEKS